MPPDEIERKLADLAPPPPRPALREALLAKVECALDARASALDRTLARPWPWIAAAVLLVCLLVGGSLEERNHQQRHLALVGEHPSPQASPADIRTFLFKVRVVARHTSEGDDR